MLRITARVKGKRNLLTYPPPLDIGQQWKTGLQLLMLLQLSESLSTWGFWTGSNSVWKCLCMHDITHHYTLTPYFLGTLESSCKWTRFAPNRISLVFCSCAYIAVHHFLCASVAIPPQCFLRQLLLTYPFTCVPSLPWCRVSRMTLAPFKGCSEPDFGHLLLQSSISLFWWHKRDSTPEAPQHALHSSLELCWVPGSHHLWGEVSVQHALVVNHRHKDLFVDRAKHMFVRACDQDGMCQIKSKELRRNINTRDKRRQSGRGHVTCPFFDELDWILHNYSTTHARHYSESVACTLPPHCRRLTG